MAFEPSENHSAGPVTQCCKGLVELLFCILHYTVKY